jgi:beta-glucanase (GH16 family)
MLWLLYQYLTGGDMRLKKLFIGLTVLIVIAAIGVRTTGTEAATQTFGNTTAGSLTDYGDANHLNGSRFKTGSTGGTLTSMSAYVAAIGSSPNNKYQLAIYADSGNQPGALIAKSASGTLVANSWNTLPITATITANTNYWLMYNTNGSNLTKNNLKYANGGTGGYTTNGATFGTIPSPFGAFTGNTLSFSIYGTYTVASAPTPPTVALTTPANGATVSGTAQAVSANASDAVGVAGVQFKLDGANLSAEDTTAPYSVTWNTTSSTNASHTLTAVARNTSGLTSTSSVVTVTVSNVTATPPTVAITIPVANSTVGGSVAVSANASDAVSVAGVQFKLDGVNLGTEDTTTPYSVAWDTTIASNATHILTAVARNTSSLTTTSSPITVTVSNAPATPTGLTASSSSTTQVDLNWTASSSATSYKVYRNGNLVGSPSTTTFQDTGLTAATSYNYTVSAVNTFGLESAQSAPVTVTTAAQTTTQTFGNTTVGSLTDEGDANYLNGSQFTAGSTSGTLSSMSAFVAAIGSSPNNKYQLAIYADSGNQPGALIAKSAEGTLVANSWNTLPITAAIAANTKYWLMYNTNGTNIAVNNLKLTTGGTGGYTSNGASFGTIPSPFGAFTANTLSFSIYATYTVAVNPALSATPTGLIATAPSTTQVDLNWTTSSGATSYKVYRDGVLVASPTTTNFQDVGLTAATNYSYTVSAVNTSGESAQSGAAMVTTLSNAPGTIIFFDDFLGASVDSTKWDVYDRISDQTNSEVNCMVPANVSVSDGILNGLTKYEDYTCGDSQQAPVLEHYTSWQIAQKTAPFQYGTVEVRAKEPGGTGIWPTIFLLGGLWQPSQAATANIPGHDWPNGGWGEVDIAEFLYNNRMQVNNVAHVNASGGTVLAPLPYDATSRFMVYRLEWSANSLIFSVDAEDGVGFRTLRTITDPNNIPNVPYYLTINAAVGGNGGGTPDPNSLPQTFQLDWVRITQ